MLIQELGETGYMPAMNAVEMRLEELCRGKLCEHAATIRCEFGVIET